MEFKQIFSEKVQYAENVIKSYMPDERSFQKTVIEVMEYTMFAGGKRIRPVLMQAVYEMLDGKDDICEPFMAAMEMIHTYSLIHDDLPALDNDDYRRGRETAHIKFDEAMAILAGDSLLNYAYETAAKAFDLILQPISLEDARVGEEDCISMLMTELRMRRQVEEAMKVLAHNPGIYGMIGGQVADVELTGTRLNEEQLEYIYVNKTGALIEASMLIGAILSGAEESICDKVKAIAYNVGMAFQIQDDILDETATFEELGKPIHSDEDNNKITYVTIHGIEASKQKVQSLSQEAITMLNELDGDSSFLESLIAYLIERKN